MTAEEGKPMKRTIRGILVTFISAFLIGLTPLPAATDTILNVPQKAQEHDQWCWAGTAQAVLEYYGVVIDQCALANWAWGRSDCCGNQTFSWSNTACNWWNYMYGSYNGHDVPGGTLQGILTNWGVQSNAIAAALSKTTAVAEIDAQRPFVMRFGWTTGGGHFLDGYGYDLNGQYIDYMDPWPGNGYTKSLYSWVVSASDHQWTHTLQITNNPARLLSVIVSGSGSVEGSSTTIGVPHDIFCISGTGACSAGYPLGSRVDLTATPDARYTFGSWSGACTSDPCSVTMDAARSVTATFAQAPLAKNNTTGITYATLAGALAEAAAGAELLILGIQHDGAVSLNKKLVLNGGWNATYQAKSGLPTTLNGDLTNQNGDSSAEALVVKGMLTVHGGSLRVNGVTVQP